MTLAETELPDTVDRLHAALTDQGGGYTLTFESDDNEWSCTLGDNVVHTGLSQYEAMRNAFDSTQGPETLNACMVTVKDGKVAVLMPSPSFTREEALTHAAWLVTFAAMEDPRPSLDVFAEYLTAVQNT